jgi:hypothetical protein
MLKKQKFQSESSIEAFSLVEQKIEEQIIEESMPPVV